MNKAKFIISLMLTGVLVLSQVAVVFAAPTLEDSHFISGTVQKITLEADPSTGLTTVLVTVISGNGQSQVVRIALEVATDLGLVTLDGDGKPVINPSALGQLVEIDPSAIISQEKQNPVGSALSTFFSDVDGLDYAVIMQAHEMGNGFGVIAQVLWLTRKLDGDASVFLAILTAKKDNDFSAFSLPDGSSPANWGQLKKAIMDGDKKGKLGLVMSNKDNTGTGKPNNSGNDNNKDKDKDKSNNGNGNGNGKKP